MLEVHRLGNGFFMRPLQVGVPVLQEVQETEARRFWIDERCRGLPGPQLRERVRA